VRERESKPKSITNTHNGRGWRTKKTESEKKNHWDQLSGAISKGMKDVLRKALSPQLHLVRRTLLHDMDAWRRDVSKASFVYKSTHTILNLDTLTHSHTHLAKRRAKGISHSQKYSR
jgi:hypothetical protein